MATQLAHPAVLVPATAAAGLLFTFVRLFSYASFRLCEAPFGFSPVATSLVFSLWGSGPSARPQAGSRIVSAGAR